MSKLTKSVCAVLALAGAALAQNSSVITLVMPVGARQLGMGEVSTALADDVFATYWNPAGLAFGPLSDEWEVSLTPQLTGGRVSALCAVKRTSFFNRGEVWAGAEKGLWRYDGRAWKDGSVVSLDQGDQVETVMRRALGNLWPLDTAAREALMQQVRKANGISSASEEKDLVDLKLPYSLAIPSAVRALNLDETGKLWIGTPLGLRRFDGKSWKSFDSAGLPSNNVTALASAGASLWIGTESGLARLKQKGSDFEIRRFGENFGLRSQRVSAVAVDARGREIWVGTADGGLSRLEITKEASTWKMFGTADGLLSDSVKALSFDPSGGLWVAHAAGLSHWNGKVWERVAFPGIEVRSLAVDKKGAVWISTDKGAWKYFPEEASKKAAGARTTTDGAANARWIHYHAGNGLGASEAGAIVAQGEDLWFSTPVGIVRERKAHAQLGFFYETLLPSLNLKDLFHTFAGATFPVEEWGTVGGYINFLSFGENSITNEAGEEVQKFSSYEMVGAVSYGTRLTRDWGLGLNLKFLYSALAPGITIGGQKQDGTAASYAFDVGAIRRNAFVQGLDFGFYLQNIGPSVFYIDKSQSDPIPLTWRFGTAYKVFQNPVHSLKIAADFSRETVSRDVDGQARGILDGIYYGISEPWGEGKAPAGAGVGDIAWHNLEEAQYNVGAEYVYSGLLALRSGMLFDPAGQRQELDIGIGVSVSDVLQVDAAYIKPVSFIGNVDNSVRDGQTRFSMTFLF